MHAHSERYRGIPAIYRLAYSRNAVRNAFGTATLLPWEREDDVVCGSPVGWQNKQHLASHAGPAVIHVRTRTPIGSVCMHGEHAPPATSASPERHSYARLHRRGRPLARSVWITLVIGTLGISFASLPTYLTQLRTPCARPVCGFQQLTPEQVEALAGMGLSLGAYAAYVVAIALANLVVCVAVSMVIALRRPDERMAFIVALMLLTLGPLAVGENVAESTSPWRAPNHYLSNLCIGLLLLVFSLFP